MKKKIAAAIICCIMATIGGYAAFDLLVPQVTNEKKQYVFIDRDDTIDSVYFKIEQAGKPRRMTGLKWLFNITDYAKRIKTGRYAVEPNVSMLDLYKELSRGVQTPVMLTIPSVRSLDKMAKTLSRQLMLDSAEIAQPLYDSVYYSQLGYTRESLPCLFVPNTYEVYWNISKNDLIKRIKKEHDRYWNDKRQAQAQAIGLTPEQVVTLASIVEEETANNAEKPIVAGLYMNRLNTGMPLQADPTVKYAVGDFSLRRILNDHLAVESPYNTYLHIGLPPGPIRIPSIVGIESVLNYNHHNYLYMCAKEDFSGTHNFASTLAQHNANAQKYWEALNARNIK